MAKIYLSSTFSDLEEYRRAVHDALRKLGHVVIAMEDYVATDARPLDKCLKDVEECDAYVLLVAWRYGYVPVDGNPDRRSITELEYREAIESGKPRFVFLLADDAQWNLQLTDHRTGDGEGGKRIDAFRKELTTGRLASMFSNVYQLAQLVTAAVTRWERESAPEAPAAPAPPVKPHARQLSHPVLVAYCEGADADLALRWSGELAARWPRVRASATALFAEQPADFVAIEKDVVASHAVMVVLGKASLDVLRARADRVAQVMALLEARTRCLVVVLHGIDRADYPREWAATSVLTFAAGAADTVVDAPAVAQAAAELQMHSPTIGLKNVIGVPYVVVAMTRSEALDVRDHPELLEQDLTKASYDRFLRFRDDLVARGVAWEDRYGTSRLDWRPFTGRGAVERMLDEIVSRLNAQGIEDDRRLALQYYPFDPVTDWNANANVRAIYRQITATGCVAVVDEMSLFHAKLRAALGAFISGGQVAVVTVSPFDAVASEVSRFVEDEARRQLGGAFVRFEQDLDPQCELGVDQERRLKRWLHANLPETLRHLDAPPPDRSKLSQFRDQVGADRKRGVSSLVWTRD